MSQRGEEYDVFADAATARRYPAKLSQSPRKVNHVLASIPLYLSQHVLICKPVICRSVRIWVSGYVFGYLGTYQGTYFASQELQQQDDIQQR
jgi:hypothetical protein